ncbi:hypothetical protein AMAG_09931 [Allomyces macrogynus ATCC 38327]|uniref:Uncharacterized protein n=1 Tax=Allomyces macrogynus (strain ATCC 38327) TaxID=578462 RepID=A0A0L0SQ05_ALLM3|nr:hypothetical protein AMAG_09931 [Allomyces macrogynus ATCC 38327]|eukprot:KNE64572.1 hypothetical protein AMAG_09931 [Allomyces macrogynus ATCC 38327]
MQPARRTSGDSSDSDDDDAPEAVSLTASKDQHRTRARAERGAVTSAKQAVKDRNRARDAAIKAQKPTRGASKTTAAPAPVPAPASDVDEDVKEEGAEEEKDGDEEDADADALPADFLQQLAAREDEDEEEEEEDVEDDGPRATIDIAASKSFKFDDDDEFDDDLMDLDDDDDSPSLPAGLEVVALSKLAAADVATPPIASAANFLEMRLRKTARRQPILNSLSRTGQPALDMAAKPGLVSGSKSGRDLRLKKTKRGKKGGVGKAKARR